MNALNKLLVKRNETELKIDQLIAENFKTTDIDAIANIKALLVKNLNGPDSILPNHDFEPEATESEDKKIFESKEQTLETIWELVNKSKEPMCALDVYEKLSKKWIISKNKVNGVLVMQTEWFRKLKKKKNSEGKEVYFYKAKA